MNRRRPDRLGCGCFGLLVIGLLIVRLVSPPIVSPFILAAGGAIFILATVWDVRRGVSLGMERASRPRLYWAALGTQLLLAILSLEAAAYWLLRSRLG